MSISCKIIVVPQARVRVYLQIGSEGVQVLARPTRHQNPINKGRVDTMPHMIFCCYMCFFKRFFIGHKGNFCLPLAVTESFIPVDFIDVTWAEEYTQCYSMILLGQSW